MVSAPRAAATYADIEALPPGVNGQILVPDWACEIFSPGSRRVDQVVKPPVYARHGLAHLWLVDPQAQSIQTMRLEDGRWILTGRAVGVEEEAALEPFQDAPLDLAFVWSD